MKFFDIILNSNIIKSILIILLCFILYKIIRKLLTKSLLPKSKKKKIDAKHITYIKLITNILKYFFLCISILLILQVNGVNVSSLIAGLGIASAIIGLALQDALKDIIMGSNILTDNFFMVGDVIKYKDIQGKVLSIGLKNTKIKDIYTNDIVSITNRNIDQITNLSTSLYVSIPVSYSESINKVKSVLNTACNEIQSHEHVNFCKCLGIGEFSDSSLIYKLEIDCKPEFRPSVKIACLNCVKVLFDKNNIEIPYKQMDIHIKKQ